MSPLYLSRRFFFAVFLFSILVQTLIRQTLTYGAEVTRYGACLIRSELGGVDNVPNVVFSDDAISNGWKLVQGEAFTGLDAHRFYFTVEALGANVPAPLIFVEWKGVKIERALGVDSFIETNDGVQLKPVSRTAPTGAFTEISIGAVRLGVFHNWEIRRCGPYREGRYPEVEIRAHLNYLLAILEVCRAYGWTDTSEPNFVDHINLYGFETNFPNGHRDFPPHFHVMLAWDGWSAAQVGHYLLDSKGNIVKNTFWSLHKDLERHDLPSVTTPYRDKTDRLVFETIVQANGAGLVLVRPEDDAEYLVRPGNNGVVESTEVCRRSKSAPDDWHLLCEVFSNDDAVNGIFASHAKYVDGTVQTVSFKYDPDTGARRAD